MGRAITLTDYAYVTSEIVVGVIVILNNALVLLAIVRTEALHKAQYYFFASLASADLLVGILVPPSVILSYWGWPHNFHGCLLLNSVVILITNISLLSMVAVTLDRYLAICHPVLYTKEMNVRRAFYISAAGWVVAILIGLVPVMGWNKGEENFKGYCAFIFVISMYYMVYMIFFGINLPLLVLMFGAYAYIFRVMRKLETNRKMRNIRNAANGAKAMLTIISVFTVCWMPLHVLNCISVFAPEKSPRVEVLLFAIVLSHANSFMNPFIYTLKNSKIRDAFADMCCASVAAAIQLDTMPTVYKDQSAATLNSKRTDSSAQVAERGDMPGGTQASRDRYHPGDTTVTNVSDELRKAGSFVRCDLMRRDWRIRTYSSTESTTRDSTNEGRLCTSVSSTSFVLDPFATFGMSCTDTGKKKYSSEVDRSIYSRLPARRPMPKDAASKYKETSV
ncbi:hypothetical protein BaRGS_00001839 [Batillaria attramentaria]|uniref:G-protein coupled receptors family 1 profile domain-containing protein n=1 Tax=Batillaria attramentaria TaxID=370345 RepID=A0ABD0M729_9CAEN